MHFKSDVLSDVFWLSHCFFSKKGGVSQGVYRSLNCGPGSQDDPKSIDENRKICAKYLTGHQQDMMTCHQIHSNKVIYLDAMLHMKPEADALVTDQSGLIIGVLTADCVPLLFVDTKRKLIGAAHAGWKGAFNGIIENTLSMMQERGAQLQDIIAVSGPSIAQASYEVSSDFRQNFLDQSTEHTKYFMLSDKTDHFLFDLKAYVGSRLKSHLLKEIEVSPIDTYTQKDDYFSYRRMCHLNEPDYGRQFSGIVILD